jgi:ribonuclease P protein component
MIPFINRFHGHSSLGYVYKKGQAARSRWFIVKVIKNPSKKNSRAAAVISKKVLKGAVKRNRVRRQVYEYLSKLLPKLDKTYDIAVIALSGELYRAPQNEIFTELDQLFDQLNISK